MSKAVNNAMRHLFVATGSQCCPQDAVKVREALALALDKQGIKDVKAISTGCFGACSDKGASVKVFPDNVIYSGVTPADAEAIVAEHIKGGKPVERLLFKKPESATPTHFDQIRIALRNCGLIDPERVEDYVAVRGYEALAKAVTSQKPEEIVEQLKIAGLRGRGGAGFPTWMKWDIARKVKGEQKYVICNADEGDPGAFMDRSVLEGDPHSVLEAMAICGFVMGADTGIIYIRAEYPLAVKRLRIAIQQAEDMGLLGDKLFGTDFSFHIRLNLGAGAFVCGEETALLNSAEGNRGEPRVKPPFPAEKGYWNRPSNINNVETFANVCSILLNGGEWYASIGTEKSKGTKVFALTGKINNVGLIEVPMGMTLREIIYNIGGGIPDGKAFKAVQTGGPSGGCLPASMLDMPIDYESLVAAGSMVGSGGMIVMDEDDCMVDIARFYLDFTVDESCGKCTPCRIGNRRLLEILERITGGEGTEDDLDALKSLGEVIRDCSLCNLGMTAPNPVLSTLNFFMDEYEAHVRQKRCPAHKCKSMMEYHILPDKCTGCTICARNCPVSCIAGERKQAHKIDPERCIKCGACKEKCPFGAIAFD